MNDHSIDIFVAQIINHCVWMTDKMTRSDDHYELDNICNYVAGNYEKNSTPGYILKNNDISS